VFGNNFSETTKKNSEQLIMQEQTPWQIKMFKKGLKKNLRLKSLRRYLRDIGDEEKCLLATCGDNNGAMNYFLRELGGNWSWADLEDTCIAEMSELLGDPVSFAADEKLPFEDDSFDRVIAIDVHEHVDDPDIITRELHRVTSQWRRIEAGSPYQTRVEDDKRSLRAYTGWLYGGRVARDNGQESNYASGCRYLFALFHGNTRTLYKLSLCESIEERRP
jgi:SAM-dependent methyltransferase